MTTQPQSSGPLLPVSLKVTQSFLDRMQRLDNGQNRSATIRTCAELGLDWLEDQSNLRAFEAYNLLQRAEALAASWPVGRTAAGNYWAPSPAQMPDQLKPGEMVASPDGVLARLSGGTITVDMAEGEVSILTEAGRIWAHPIDRKLLWTLVPAVSNCLIPLATSSPGEVFRLPAGLSFERIESGALVLCGGGHELGIGIQEAFAWSAELAGLLAGRLKHDGSRVMALEQQLKAPAVEVPA
jgi:hypothetical protein